MFEIYEPHELLGAVEIAGINFDPLYLALFFPNVYEFGKKTILLDEIPADTPIALYCAPKVKGKIIDSAGYETRSITPPYVKPKHEVELERTLKRKAGESPVNSTVTPQERHESIVMDNLAVEERAIVQLEEYQAVEAVVTGQIVASSPEHPEVVINMGRRAENNIVLTGSAVWSLCDKTTHDPDDDIDKWSEKSDGETNIVIMDKSAYALYKSFKAIKERTKKESGSNTDLELGLKDLGKAVSYKGQTGSGIDIVVYSGEYQKTDGTKAKYQPLNTIVLGHTSLEGLRLYAVIQNRKAIKTGMQVASRFAHHWEETGDPSNEYTQTESAPTMFLPKNVVNSFVSVVVD